MNKLLKSAIPEEIRLLLLLCLLFFSKFVEHFYAQNNVSQHNWSSFTIVAGSLKDSIHLKFIVRLEPTKMYLR
jgi:hypothetical protein